MNAYYVEHIRVEPERGMKSRGTYGHRTLAVWKIWAVTAAKAMDRARDVAGLRHTFEYLRCSPRTPAAETPVVELSGVSWA